LIDACLFSKIERAVSGPYIAVTLMFAKHIGWVGLPWDVKILFASCCNCLTFPVERERVVPFV
jgi:hypothetical protein